MNTLPPTGLILVNGDLILGYFSNYMEIALHVGAVVGDDGAVRVNGKQIGPTYCMDPDLSLVVCDHWMSKEEVLRDWAGTYMRREFIILRYLL